MKVRLKLLETVLAHNNDAGLFVMFLPLHLPIPTFDRAKIPMTSPNEPDMLPGWLTANLGSVSEDTMLLRKKDV